MKSLRTVIFVLLLAFHITLLIVIINIEPGWLLNNQELVKYVLIIALLLFSVYAFAHYLTRSSLERKIRRLEKEKNEIKAKFYDVKQEEERIDKSMKSFGESLPKKDPPDDPKL